MAQMTASELSEHSSPQQATERRNVRPLGPEHDPCARLWFVEENFQRMPTHLVAIELAEIYVALKPLQDAAIQFQQKAPT